MDFTFPEHSRRAYLTQMKLITKLLLMVRFDFFPPVCGVRVTLASRFQFRVIILEHTNTFFIFLCESLHHLSDTSTTVKSHSGFWGI